MVGKMNGSVLTRLRVSSTAKVNSFQLKMNANKAVATRPGTTLGRAISQKARILLAPFVIADSSRSGGRSSKKPFITQVTNGMVNSRYWTMSAWKVSIMPRCDQKRNIGMAIATGGMNSMDRMKNDRFLPPVR